jgi:hypothetical protein
MQSEKDCIFYILGGRERENCVHFAFNKTMEALISLTFRDIRLFELDGGNGLREEEGTD